MSQTASILIERTSFQGCSQNFEFACSISISALSFATLLSTVAAALRHLEQTDATAFTYLSQEFSTDRKMARLANLSPSVEQQDERPSRRVGPSRTPRRATSLSPSPAASFSSDKENREASPEMSRSGKNKARGPPASKLPTPASAEDSTPRTNKRRRLEDRDARTGTQAVHERELEEVADTQYYDPDQDMDQRRAVRKGLRDLTRDLNGRAGPLLGTATLKSADRSYRFPFRIPCASINRPRGHSSSCESILRRGQANFRRDIGL